MSTSGDVGTAHTSCHVPSAGPCGLCSPRPPTRARGSGRDRRQPGPVPAALWGARPGSGRVVDRRRLVSVLDVRGPPELADDGILGTGSRTLPARPDAGLARGRRNRRRPPSLVRARAGGARDPARARAPGMAVACTDRQPSRHRPRQPRRFSISAIQLAAPGWRATSRGRSSGTGSGFIARISTSRHLSTGERTTNRTDRA